MRDSCRATGVKALVVLSPVPADLGAGGNGAGENGAGENGAGALRRLAAQARTAGSAGVSVTTLAGSALAAAADVAVEVVVGAEVLRESTRLGAGTAQKIALDAVTTTAAARLGRVHGDHMIDVVGANAKLRDRVARHVAAIAGCAPERAGAALDDCAGNARAAVLCLVLGLDPVTALAQAGAHRTLRAALAAQATAGG